MGPGPGVAFPVSLLVDASYVADSQESDINEAERLIYRGYTSCLHSPVSLLGIVER